MRTNRSSSHPRGDLPPSPSDQTPTTSDQTPSNPQTRHPPLPLTRPPHHGQNEWHTAVKTVPSRILRMWSVTTAYSENLRTVKHWIKLTSWRGKKFCDTRNSSLVNIRVLVAITDTAISEFLKFKQKGNLFHLLSVYSYFRDHFLNYRPRSGGYYFHRRVSFYSVQRDWGVSRHAFGQGCG